MHSRVLLIIFLSSLVFTWFIILLFVYTLNSDTTAATDRKSGMTVDDDDHLRDSYINLTDRWAFGRYLINNSDKCTTYPVTVVKLLVLVHSAIGHFDFRRTIRQYNSAIADSVTIFFVGQVVNPSIQKLIDQESDNYGDIVQAGFHDSYENLTLKHIAALTWAAKYCPSAQLVMKMDDDIFVNYDLLGRLLSARFPESSPDQPLVSRVGHKMIACFIHQHMEVIRNTSSRWYVSETDFKQRYYPDFCSGWAYITTIDVINDLLDQIASQPLFWIDDVYVTGILRQSYTDIQLDSLNKFFNVDVSQLVNWVSDTTVHTRYQWRYAFSNANGNVSLLSSALMVNNLDVGDGHRLCCYPTATQIADYTSDSPMKLISNSNGFVKRITL